KHFFGGDGAGSGMQIGKVIKAFHGLSDESREKALAAAEKSWPDVQKSLKAVREKRDAVKKILAQPEYKQEDLDKAFAEVRAEVNKLMEAGQVLGSDILRELTPEERLKLLKKLPRPPAE
ncbi:MAG: periplasmic heavy metal sensor, partial [Alphaproteobacteria bacterium]|nr:periplasmic heavy metal sensor [Alphaproteobacteria bacterium]